jgi:hypothetical protein
LNFLPSCHVDKGDIFTRQLFKENQDTSVVGMSAPKDSVTCAETDSASPYILLVLRILNPTVILEKAEL